MSKFKTGDLVSPKNENLKMTVVKVQNENQILCEFENVGSLKFYSKKTFLEDMLDYYNPRSQN